MLVLELSCLTMAIPSTQGVSQVRISFNQINQTTVSISWLLGQIQSGIKTEPYFQEGESMEPPGARYERSTPSSLKSLRREMLGMFEEQEERLAEQEMRIARQGETILKLEETIAEQQKTIEEQNQTIQMIAKHPDLRDFLQGIKTEALSPAVLGKFNLSILRIS